MSFRQDVNGYVVIFADNAEQTHELNVTAENNGVSAAGSGPKILRLRLMAQRVGIDRRRRIIAMLMARFMAIDTVSPCAALAGWQAYSFQDVFRMARMVSPTDRRWLA